MKQISSISQNTYANFLPNYLWVLFLHDTLHLTVKILPPLQTLRLVHRPPYFEYDGARASVDTPQLVWVPLFLAVGEANSTVGETSLDLALLIAFGVPALLIVILTRGRLATSQVHIWRHEVKRKLN